MQVHIVVETDHFEYEGTDTQNHGVYYEWEDAFAKVKEILPTAVEDREIDTWDFKEDQTGRTHTICIEVWKVL